MSRRSRRRATTLGELLLVAGVLACSRSPHVNADVTPTIVSIRPDSVNVPRGNVVEVVIVGRGFAPGKPGMNTIHFAGMTFTQVPSNDDGTEVRFVIPDVIASTSEAAPMPLETGPYALRVATAAGTSNPMTIRIYR